MDSTKQGNLETQFRRDHGTIIAFRVTPELHEGECLLVLLRVQVNKKLITQLRNNKIISSSSSMVLKGHFSFRFHVL